MSAKDTVTLEEAKEQVGIALTRAALLHLSFSIHLLAPLCPHTQIPSFEEDVIGVKDEFTFASHGQRLRVRRLHWLYRFIEEGHGVMEATLRGELMVPRLAKSRIIPTINKGGTYK